MPCIHATILKFDHTDHSWSEYAAWYAADKYSQKQQHILQIVMNHQSNQVKTCKSYEYWSANANFSELCDKGHKTKGQILLYLYGSLWTKSSGFLVFIVMSSTYCIARTLLSLLVMTMTLFSKFQKFHEDARNLLNKVIFHTSVNNDFIL